MGRERGRLTRRHQPPGRNVSEMRSIEAVKARGFGGANSSPDNTRREAAYTSTKKATDARRWPFRGGSRIRTGDPMLAKHVLYQLSYTPFSRFFLVVASLDFAPHFVTTARLLLNRRSSALQPLKNKLRTYTKKAGLVSGFSVGPGRVELPTSTLSV